MSSIRCWNCGKATTDNEVKVIWTKEEIKKVLQKKYVSNKKLLLLSPLYRILNSQYDSNVNNWLQL